MYTIESARNRTGLIIYPNELKTKDEDKQEGKQSRAKDYMYLGEDCRNKRHFNCEGFIAWVVIKALGKDRGTWQKEINWQQSESNSNLRVYHANESEYVSSIRGTIHHTNPVELN